MTQAEYKNIEAYMLACMAEKDPAHSAEHIYRVLANALEIAQSEPEADTDLLITACLLHDIGRQEQFADPAKCHAAVGAEKACRWLTGSGYPETFAQKVADCIRTHRYRADDPPRSIEAKILFDADKLDAAGAMGIARTLLYKGQVGEPLYTRTAGGRISDGTDDPLPSFFQEYKYKLEGLYGKFYTRRGAELSRQRQAAAQAFYQALLTEAQQSDGCTGQLARLLQS